MVSLCRESWLESFVTSSKRNAVCIGESRGVAAVSGAAAPATLKEKRVKKKKKKQNNQLVSSKSTDNIPLFLFLLSQSYKHLQQNCKSKKNSAKLLVADYKNLHVADLS